ncbi:MAG TPA: right-handed parallel beta-helix repeat-containing protein [Chitinivibrionales bacterium]|jgi:parallel beta-helix repeat protein|nr:right-handed parallel beta-helix repeat-containing protein [Chitinivibrionales bacterium]
MTLSSRTRTLPCFLAAFTILVSSTAWPAESISVPSVGVKTIAQGMISAKSGDTVWVSDGVYKELVFIKAGVVCAARNPLKAIIDGGGKGTVVTLSSNSVLDGFEIRGGTIGVFSKDPGNTVINCRIINNWGTGIICVRHLPKIEDNIIAFNRWSGIQGWDIRSTAATINHNTVCFNGNNGITLGGSSDAIIENNMIAFNERLGVKLSQKSDRTKLSKNDLFGNLAVNRIVPADNFSFDPKFANPRTKLDFKVAVNQPCCMYGSDNKILGSRILGEEKKQGGM